MQPKNPSITAATQSLNAPKMACLRPIQEGGKNGSLAGRRLLMGNIYMADEGGDID
jgi:hypothetical protein